MSKEEPKKRWIIITNYASGLNFKNIIRKVLNLYNILANEIKVTQGDNGIDIIAIYQNNIALIQCKNIESAISVKIIREFESSVLRYPNFLGIIVYNSKKNKGNKLTPKAKIWVSTLKENIKVCNEKEKVEVIKELFSIKPEEKDYIITNYKADES
ncbi:hypothetical protein C2G38_2033569 [Gigaspora rosea]|uniref:Restriction endonuclease type IV Mrr domain-containing protein n=1 Tax=Gigaspora rosea TaxID=44941 RepID=A0A397VKR0_9GLOM|nr:hypothetical protein C2G38_2033569 [Gigaspora rosea]